MWRSGAPQRRIARAAPKWRRCTYEQLYEVPGSSYIRRWYTLPFKPPGLDTNKTPRTRYNQKIRPKSDIRARPHVSLGPRVIKTISGGNCVVKKEATDRD